jgi:phosphoketolase
MALRSRAAEHRRFRGLPVGRIELGQGRTTTGASRSETVGGLRVNESLRKPQMMAPLTPELLEKMDAYWRAANYLTVGQIYLQDNPLLEIPLTLQHIKPRLLGHWGTTTGINFIYVHLNRLIKEHDLNMITWKGHTPSATRISSAASTQGRTLKG